MKAFPHIKDLVTDVSWNLRGEEAHPQIQAAQARRAGRHLAHGAGRCRPRAGVPQVHRMLPLPGRLPRAARPSHARPIHRPALPGLRRRAGNASARYRATAFRNCRKAFGIGLCNITKCCTKVCPESITITDNAIIPLKERVVDRFFDPLTKLFRMFGRKKLGDFMHFELEIDLRGEHPGGASQSRTLPAFERAAPGGKHLPRHFGCRAGSPAGADFAAAGAHRSISVAREREGRPGSSCEN